MKTAEDIVLEKNNEIVKVTKAQTVAEAIEADHLQVALLDLAQQAIVHRLLERRVGGPHPVGGRPREAISGTTPP